MGNATIVELFSNLWCVISIFPLAKKLYIALVMMTSKHESRKKEMDEFLANSEKHRHHKNEILQFLAYSQKHRHHQK